MTKESKVAPVQIKLFDSAAFYIMKCHVRLMYCVNKQQTEKDDAKNLLHVLKNLGNSVIHSIQTV